jgi:hypothetical protein
MYATARRVKMVKRPHLRRRYSGVWPATRGGMPVSMRDGPRPGAAKFGCALALACVVMFATGCTAPRGPLVVTSPDPSVKIPAIKKAVRKNDRGAAGQLVRDLDNDDPAVRFYAIGALERMTGESMGYRYFDDEADRAEAVQRWRQWLDGRQAVARTTDRRSGARGR